MKKPSLAVLTSPHSDYDLGERITRELEHSHLHIVWAYGRMRVPAAIGDPNDVTTSLLQDLTMLSDGKRGWLVLAEALREYDVAVEVDNLMRSLLEIVPEPPRCSVRAVGTQFRRPRAIKLSRSVIEAEYERAFADGHPSPDIEPLLASMRELGWLVKSELELREQINDAVRMYNASPAPFFWAS